MWVGIGVGIGRNRFATGIFDAYALRVTADGGITEAGQCVDAVTGILLNASLLLIPSGYKGGKLYSEIPTNGNGDLTWTRGSDAFRTNASGVIQRVPWNLAQQSETFDNASWTKFATTITANTALSPNGTLTADNAVPNTTNTDHSLTQSVVQATSGTTYTISVFAKPNGYNFIRLSFGNVAGGGYTFFDVSNGTIGGTSSMLSNSITPVGNGWYRCTVSRTATTSGTLAIDIYIVSENNQFSWAGNGTDGVYIWGAQVVEGTTAQTYLPTTDRLNFPRLSYMYGSCPSALLEPQRTNSIRNSTMVGASTSPSTLPTNYSSSNGGLTISVVGVGVENGLNYIDVRFQGTATGTIAQIGFDTATSNNATANQTYIFSLYSKLISGSANSYGIIWDEWSSTPIYLTTKSTNVSLTSTTTRFSLSGTTASTCATIQPFLRFVLTIGVAYDFTFRVLQPQLELGAYFTTPIFTSGTFATRVADSFSRNNIYTNGLISASGGTWFVELRGNVAYTRDAFTNTPLIIGDNATSPNNGLMLRNSGGSSMRLEIRKLIAGTTTLLYTTLTDTIKIAFKWNGSSVDVFVNGTKQVSASFFSTTNMDFLVGNGVDVPKFIQQMSLHPEPLTDAKLIELTTL